MYNDNNIIVLNEYLQLTLILKTYYNNYNFMGIFKKKKSYIILQMNYQIIIFI